MGYHTIPLIQYYLLKFFTSVILFMTLFYLMIHAWIDSLMLFNCMWLIFESFSIKWNILAGTFTLMIQKEIGKNCEDVIS